MMLENGGNCCEEMGEGGTLWTHESLALQELAGFGLPWLNNLTTSHLFDLPKFIWSQKK